MASGPPSCWGATAVPSLSGPAATGWVPGYDAPVTATRRPLGVAALAFAATLLVGIAAGCSAGPPPTSSSRSASPAVSASTAPGGAVPSIGRSSSIPPTTTNTEFGEIFDALPPSFPKLAGAEPVETSAAPTSGSFAVNLEPAAASGAIATGLKAQGWTVDIGSPLEDGSVVLEATGPTPGCKSEVRFTPVSGTVIMSVLYGASCPFS